MVAAVVMTVLAQIGHFFHQQRFMAAAMRGVADRAILCNRRVFPDERSTFVGMAFVTELGNVFGADHAFCLSAVGIVAIGALDLAFNDGMMRHLVDVGTDTLMTVEAHRGLFYRGTGRMNVMAGDTGHIVLFVCAHVPQGQMG